jgi:hypothetical protein
MAMNRTRISNSLLELRPPAWTTSELSLPSDRQRVRETPKTWAVDRYMSGFPGRARLGAPNTVTGMEQPVLKSYLVEAYVPNLDQGGALAITAALEGAADRLSELGMRVEWNVTFATYAEETYFAVVAAPSEALARQLIDVAGLRVDHLVEVAHFWRAGQPTAS